ncbi:circularly permuted type 2 ATP-grasp protein, partial [Ralstonia pickettii]|uniref:circularly permuted type 2 ATP-grasp protein n=1 Tax=Ralstonia pickettii TaxID=329 RepID=UPI002155FA8B
MTPRTVPRSSPRAARTSRATRGGARLRHSWTSRLPSSITRDPADPRVVILTPGALSETAYDQAYLAGALGFPLVQGSDLVVWEGWLWVKPSGWPEVRPTERVDVILRRVDA